MRTSSLQRRTPLRRVPFRSRMRATSYSRRPRDLERMLWIKGLLCSVEEERPDPFRDPTPCTGRVQADHMGMRGLGQKADDSTCAPMCERHHRERTDKFGSFAHVSREDLRAWCARAIARTQQIWSER